MPENASVWTLVWTFVNSPLGVTLIVSVVSAVLTMIFKAKPGAEKLVDEHSGLFFDAIRHAEKAIPDNTTNKSAQRADAALKYLLKLETPLKKKKEAKLREALTVAHKRVEEKATKPGG